MVEGKVINFPVKPMPTLDEISDWRIEINKRYDERVIYSGKGVVFIFIKSIDRLPVLIDSAKEHVLNFLENEAKLKATQKNE